MVISAVPRNSEPQQRRSAKKKLNVTALPCRFFLEPRNGSDFYGDFYC
jgi:hypothetical protein